MLNAGYLQYIQSSGISNELSDSDVILFDQYKRLVQQFLHSHTEQSVISTWTEERRKRHKEDLIASYVTENPRKVRGYFIEGTVNIQALLKDLRRDIILEGILTEALEDEEINELQINHWDGAIFVEKHGRYVPYTDKEGKPYRFNSAQELDTLISAMIDSGDANSQRATIGKALINTKTARSYYRVSITHDSVVTKDLPPYDAASMTVTLRKFKREQLRLEDLVRSGTMSHDMALFTSYIGSFDGKVLTVGATASGKTTLLGIIVRTISDNIRIILCQNPTEIVHIKRAPDGHIINNAIHWEARTPGVDEKITPEYPTMANLITHGLRNSPQVMVVGEMRAPEEFNEGFRAIITGHRLLASLHSENDFECCERCVAELASCGGNVSDAALRRKVASAIDIIFAQKKLEDGARKVMSITELAGRVDDKGYPVLNRIYEYVYAGKVEYDLNGRVKKIHGEHKRVGKLTARCIDKFYAAGFSRDELLPFMSEVPQDYRETYTCVDGEFDLTAKRRARALLLAESG